MLVLVLGGSLVGEVVVIPLVGSSVVVDVESPVEPVGGSPVGSAPVFEDEDGDVGPPEVVASPLSPHAIAATRFCRVREVAVVKVPDATRCSGVAEKPLVVLRDE